MDYSKVAPSDRTIKMLSGSGEPTGISVVVCSVNDDRLKSTRRKIQDKRIYLEARGKSFKAEELDENQSTIAFAAITSWDWGKDAEGKPNTFGDKPPELDRKTAFAVFEKLSWFRDQIMEAISDEKSFFTQSAPN